MAIFEFFVVLSLTQLCLLVIITSNYTTDFSFVLKTINFKKPTKKLLSKS